MNVTQFGGQPVVTAGLNGMMGVGGNVAKGSIPSAYPIYIAAINDASVQVITPILSDSLGRLQISTLSQKQTVNDLGYLNTYKNILAVQDLSQSDGNTWVDLLNQILLELKILNQQIYELPRILQSTSISQDPPESYRADPTVFNSN